MDGLVVYMQRVVRVRAVRWWPPGHPEHRPNESVEHHHGEFKIGTSHGWRTLHPGDYIVVDHMGRTYPCRPEVFEAAYEPEQQCQRTEKDSAGS